MLGWVTCICWIFVCHSYVEATGDLPKWENVTSSHITELVGSTMKMNYIFDLD